MVFYHLTSYQNAQIIYKFGFKRGNSGMLGPGIYFAEKAYHTLRKSTSGVKDTIIVAEVNTGRQVDVNIPHSDWNMELVKSLGYDSVRKNNCRTGPEICVYEPHRVRIIGIVHWDNNNIEFLINHGYSIDMSEFNFLTERRKTIIVHNYANSCLECYFGSTSNFITDGMSQRERGREARRMAVYRRGSRELNGV